MWSCEAWTLNILLCQAKYLKFFILFLKRHLWFLNNKSQKEFDNFEIWYIIEKGIKKRIVSHNVEHI